jgi:hypothetical protein
MMSVQVGMPQIWACQHRAISVIAELVDSRSTHLCLPVWHYVDMNARSEYVSRKEPMWWKMPEISGELGLPESDCRPESERGQV